MRPRARAPRALALLGTLLAAACGDGTPSPAPPLAAEGAAGPPWFEERAAERGIDFVHRSGHEERYWFPEIMGGGGALLDMEGDGDLDLYLVQSGSVVAPREERPGNRLYRNEGQGRFADASEGSGAEDRGYGMGAAVGDADGDGLPDLYVLNLAENVLYRNANAGRFEDVTALAGGADPSWSVSGAFFDPDRDGDLDLFVVNYVIWSLADDIECHQPTSGKEYCGPRSYGAPAPDTLYRNDGTGTLTDVSAAANLRTAFGNGLGIVCGDFDGDGWSDVFVANDGMPNQIWMNRGDLTFEDRAFAMGCAVDEDGGVKAGMGVSAIDLDDDGDEEILVVNLAKESDSLHINQGTYFSDRTKPWGLGVASRPYTRFGVAFADFDNDGWPDVYEANGRVERPLDILRGGDPYAEPDVLLRGAAGRFEEVLPRGGVAQPLVATSRAAIFGDVDGDGGLDVVVVNRDAPPWLLMNVAPDRGHWIRFRVLDERGREVEGATVSLRVGERTITRTARRAYSYACANEPFVHVGLGTATGVDEVSVRFPDGATQAFGGFAADRVVELRRKSR